MYERKPMGIPILNDVALVNCSKPYRPLLLSLMVTINYRHSDGVVIETESFFFAGIFVSRRFA